ncbi:MAG TPA: DUF4157 domain-containing protein, partial [Xanthomonadaceae bacterium]|jgi:hypothetical protein|nr:DUF4157 domain-containing protein [Xanthomonadaceae bacterium]
MRATAALLPVLFACIGLPLGGCAMDEAITNEQTREMGLTSPEVLASLARLQPGVVAWYREAERRGLAVGRPLNANETRIAQKVGVAHPERVRLAIDQPIPLLSDPQTSSRLSDVFGTGSMPGAAATTFGYAIYIGRNYVHDRRMLAHELTHVGQFEQLGIDGFVHDYLLQVMLFGYRVAPLERAAAANEHLGK